MVRRANVPCQNQPTEFVCAGSMLRIRALATHDSLGNSLRHQLLVTNRKSILLHRHCLLQSLWPICNHQRLGLVRRELVRDNWLLL